MYIKVKGFRGAERADLEFEGIALIAGKNGAGKSSICQAVAAALTGSPIPFFNSNKPEKELLLKKDAKLLLRAGMDVGTASVTTEEGMVIVEWPGDKVTSSGKRPTASKAACGLINPLDMEDVQRQRFLSDLLQASPSEKDIAEAAKDVGLSETKAAEIIAAVKSQGWDVAHKVAREMGAGHKGKWEAAAGTAFGIQKAEKWVPEGWSPEWSPFTENDANEAVADARQAVENAVGALAVDSAEIERLTLVAENEAGIRTRLTDAEDELKETTRRRSAAEQALAKAVVPEALVCPACAVLLELEGKQLREAQLKKGERAALVKRRTAAQEEFEAANKDHGLVLDKATKLRMEHAAIASVPKQLEAAKARTGSQQAVDEARASLAGCEKVQQMVHQVHAARRAYTQVLEQVKVVEILAPEGLRRTKLNKALTEFNTKVLAPMCVAAEFPAVTVNDELDVLYGGRRYFLLSESEKYRVKAIVQTAIAKRDGSCMVILDGADILDGDGRNGLFSMIGSETDIPHFLIAMTMNAKSKMPVLDPEEGGNSFWIADGRAESEVAAA